MEALTIVFFGFALLIVTSALFCVTSKNIFHSAIQLIFALFGVAGIFVLLEAPFLAAAQVLIYVGAIAILMVFAIMLTARIADDSIIHTNEQVPAGALISLGLLAVILYGLWETPFPTTLVEPGPGSGKRLGELFLTKFVLPFEVISVVLLVALIGALIIAKRDMFAGKDAAAPDARTPAADDPSAGETR